MLDLRITLRRGKRSVLVWTIEQSNNGLRRSDYCHGGPVPEVSGPPEATIPLARGGLPLQKRHQRRLQPPSGTLLPPTAVISDSTFEQWLQSDGMKMPMFSLSEGPQQSAPTVVALAAAAPAAEAVTGTRVFPAASLKGVAEAPASSAGAASAAVPAAAPATGGIVFPTASVGGAARAPASADATVALMTAPATGGTVPSATLVGGAHASSAVAAASEEILAAEPATSGAVPVVASIRGAVGGRESSIRAVSSDAETEATPSTGGTAAPAASTAREARSSRQQLGPPVKSAARRGHPPTPLIPVPCFRWRSTTAGTSEPDITAAAAAAAAAAAVAAVAATIPTTTTHGGMQPVLEHCCDPLIRGNDAGGVRGEEGRFSV